MKIAKEFRLVHCSDNRIKKEFLLSGPVTREFAAFFGNFGETRGVDGLKKLYFTFLIPQCLNIKGIIGESSIEVWFFPEFVSTGERFLTLLLAGSESGRPDTDLREGHRKLLEQVTGIRK